MNNTTNNSYSLPEKGKEYLDNVTGKIEVEGCPFKMKNCKHLSAVNASHHEADIYYLNKEFQWSIESLRKAYYKTFNIKDSACGKCAGLFRSTITGSLENIQLDLEKMSKGLFRTKRYLPCYHSVGELLKKIQSDSCKEETDKFLKKVG